MGAFKESEKSLFPKGIDLEKDDYEVVMEKLEAFDAESLMTKENFELLKKRHRPVVRAGVREPFVLFAYIGKEYIKREDGSSFMIPRLHDAYIRCRGNHYLPDALQNYVNKGYRVIGYWLPTEGDEWKRQHKDGSGKNPYLDTKKFCDKEMGLLSDKMELKELREKVGIMGKVSKKGGKNEESETA